MNKLAGHISDIEENGSLSLVSVEVSNELTLQAIVIDTSLSTEYLNKKNQVTLLFKETEVIIGLGSQHNSLENIIPCIVQKIEMGQLLSRLDLESIAGKITAVISSKALIRLNLELKQDVLAMVKLNEIMLST